MQLNCNVHSADKMVMNNSVLANGPTVFAFPQYAEASSTEPERNGFLFTRDKFIVEFDKRKTAFTRRHLVRWLGHQLLHWNQVVGQSDVVARVGFV